MARIPSASTCTHSYRNTDLSIAARRATQRPLRLVPTAGICSLVPCDWLYLSAGRPLSASIPPAATSVRQSILSTVSAGKPARVASPWGVTSGQWPRSRKLSVGWSARWLTPAAVMVAAPKREREASAGRPRSARTCRNQPRSIQKVERWRWYVCDTHPRVRDLALAEVQEEGGKRGQVA
eukprot:1184680-Prorocentrum_minimum.AAC.2